MRKIALWFLAWLALTAQSTGPLVDASPLTITAGGTSQTLFVALSGNRKGLTIQNPCTASSQGLSATESLFINFGTTAAASGNGSIELLACGSLTMSGGYVSQQQINIEAATTGHAFSAKETQ